MCRTGDETVDISIFKQAMDSALELAMIFNSRGDIIYANKLAQDALEYEDGIQNYSIADIFPTVFSVEGRGLIWDETKLGKVMSVMAYRGNRTCFATETRIIKDLEQSDMYICMSLDVTKKKYFEKAASQAGQHAESAEQVKTQFVANVTHELRTPVNGILGNTRELISRETEPDKQKKLKLIERGCNDMHAIINNILDFSKLEAGKFVLEKREFNFRGMMEYIKDTHINKISEKGLQFFMNISPDIPETLIGDELRIGQVLNNLLSNATKFTSAGRISVEVVKTAQINNRIELFFIVIDSGIGIAKEDQDKLFKSFSQVEASTTRKYGGTGLGLNISKQIVELMDGSIHVESERKKGTMFSFRIWVDTADSDEGVQIKQVYSMESMPSLDSFDELDVIWKYGTPENREELSKKMSKLILSVEMDNWEKAEMFMDTIKQLTSDAPGPVKSATLRLKMAVQKADYDKTIEAFDRFKDSIGDT